MKCIYCNYEIPAGSPNCPRCGSPAAAQPAQTPTPQPGQNAPQPGQYAPQPGHNAPQPTAPAVPKSRILYQLLAFFLGGLGVHNFYAGRIVIGAIQLVITVIGGGISLIVFGSPGVAALPVFVWVIVEIFAVKKDGRGIPMK